MAVAGVVLGLVALLLLAITARRIRRMRQDYAVLLDGDGAESFLAAVSRKTAEVGALRSEVGRLGDLLDRTRVELGDAIRHVSVVRYDAFGDLGGRLSFSAALLDDAADGLVVTSIHGRSETRMYMKGVVKGGSEAPLSPEEEQAIQYALRGSGRTAP
ncbi:MAG: DUF4446 family protein [Actinomycetota bacterium]|nr:MAG: DUF4446 family protein [Actinomycetota bacterium]